MSSLNEYFPDLNQKLVEDIKLYYVFDNFDLKDNVWVITGKNMLFVTKDDSVYGLGINSRGVLGLEHNNEVKEPTIITELSNNQIIDFKNGLSHCMARSSDGNVYSFGDNHWNQLGYETNHRDNNKPKLIESLSNENIKQISCGGLHTLVLTQNGRVFGWGDNSNGQIGVQGVEKTHITPTNINGFKNEKVQSVSSGSSHSTALTVNGHVFSWGNNNYGQLGINSTIDSCIPRIIVFEDKNVKFDKISCGSAHSLLLSTKGEIYSFGSNKYNQLGYKLFWNKSKQKIPLKIKFGKTFEDIVCSFDKNISTAQTIDNVCYIWGQCEEDVVDLLKNTEYKSCEEAIFSVRRISMRALSLWSYESHFEEHNIISIGGFGIVSKVSDKIEHKLYAMKRIAFKNQTKGIVLREINYLKELILIIEVILLLKSKIFGLKTTIC